MDLNTVFCSDSIVHLLTELHVVGLLDLQPNEFTPLDVRHLPPFGGHDAIVFEWFRGTFRSG